MDLYPEKIGEQGGRDFFVLKNAKTKRIVTVKEVTESKIRKFFKKHGVGDQAIDDAIHRARKRYDQAHPSDVDEGSDFFDDMIDDLGIDNDF